MAARGIATLRRSQTSLARLISSLENGTRGGCNWWVYNRQEHTFSSAATECVRQGEETATKEVVREPWPRWKELPPVPLESAVHALEEIDDARGDHDESAQGRIKRLTALRWVAKCCPDVPHSLINKLFRLRQIRMRLPVENSSESSRDPRLIRVAAKESLKEGAVLCIPSAVAQGPNEHSPARNNQEATAEDIKWLRSLVLHKDEEVIVINKPVGLAVQGGSEVTRSLDSLMGAALSYDYEEGPRLVHRLDKETSGALVVGRTHQSTVFLHALLRDKTAQLSRAPKSEPRTMERRYWALVIGIPEAKKGRISAPLAKVVTDSGKLEKMRVVHYSHPTAQESVTDYEVLGPSVLGCSWLELRPRTGRKHQIRVHCAEVLGMPIVGDYKYGWRAHRGWPPEWEGFEAPRAKDGGPAGHVHSSTPFLHLHCRRLILPDVAEVFNRQSGKQATRGAAAAAAGKTESGSPGNILDITAPLPPHMEVSWNLRPIPTIDLGV